MRSFQSIKVRQKFHFLSDIFVQIHVRLGKTQQNLDFFAYPEFSNIKEIPERWLRKRAIWSHEKRIEARHRMSQIYNTVEP